MSSLAQSIQDRIALEDTFQYEELSAWIAIPEDLELWSAAYHLLQEYSDRILPRIVWPTVYPFVLGYLLRCIQENASSDYVHSGYEAAWELAACLKRWSKRSEPEPLMRLAEQELSREFLSGNQGIRDRILNGTLEHALESPSVRPFFAQWEKDSKLQEVWRQAMDWAVHHENTADQ